MSRRVFAAHARGERRVTGIGPLCTAERDEGDEGGAIPTTAQRPSDAPQYARNSQGG